jgi:hypothetical protein
VNGSLTTTKRVDTANCSGIAAAVPSRQVAWWEVHQWVAGQLADVDDWPMAGTPAWCALDDTDPRKVAALFDAAQHHALRVETSQEQRAQASRDVSAAPDWAGLADEIYRRRSCSGYIPREVA